MLLFVGNLLFSKGIRLLAEACAILRDRAVHFRAYFVGEGRDRHRLEIELKRAGLEDRATTVGIAEQRALPDWYWASDLVVLPSYSEGIPNVLREAAMCRRPFVATNVGGISELAIHPPSRQVRPGDAMALADAIEKALVDIKHGVILPPPKEICSWDDSASAIGRILRIAVQKK